MNKYRISILILCIISIVFIILSIFINKSDNEERKLYFANSQYEFSGKAYKYIYLGGSYAIIFLKVESKEFNKTISNDNDRMVGYYNPKGDTLMMIAKMPVLFNLDKKVRDNKQGKLDSISVFVNAKNKKVIFDKNGIKDSTRIHLSRAYIDELNQQSKIYGIQTKF